MSNSFNISDKQEIAANLVQILSNASALGTIQTTTLPDIATQNTNIKAVVDAIADPQLPDILTAIGANKTEIDKLVASLPMIPFVGFKTIADVPTDSWSEALNISGSGYLHFVKSWPAATVVRIKVTIDGTLINFDNDGTPLGWTGEYNGGRGVFPYTDSIYLGGSIPPFIYDIVDDYTPKMNVPMLSIRFNTSLLVELQKEDPAGNCYFQYFYSLS